MSVRDLRAYQASAPVAFHLPGAGSIGVHGGRFAGRRGVKGNCRAGSWGMASAVEGGAVVPAPAIKVERAELPRVPRQRLSYAKEAAPVPGVLPRRGLHGARWAAPGIAGTAVVAAGSWLVLVPLIGSSSAERATTIADCVPQGDLFEVQVGMTRQAVLNSFSHAGHIEQYTPRQSLDVVHRSCARTAPWTRHLWITYAWQEGEWRVAELHKGLGIVAPD